MNQASGERASVVMAMPERMSEDMPDRMSEDMPDKMP